MRTRDNFKQFWLMMLQLHSMHRWFHHFIFSLYLLRLMIFFLLLLLEILILLKWTLYVIVFVCTGIQQILWRLTTGIVQFNRSFHFSSILALDYQLLIMLFLGLIISIVVCDCWLRDWNCDKDEIIPDRKVRTRNWTSYINPTGRW